ncbi:MAG: DEAD/DEAH box helicase [Bacteroidales bacterium]|nr:DEAD/DEAH box helicase [Bacteroidales bacterium]MBN2756389.1 DEAD/DEAH box helicase [Bacteroidales bacterium]
MQNFEDSGLKPEIIKAVKELNFENLTPIQEKTIPHMLGSDKDLVALAQTGSGKTAAFGLPIIEKLDLNSKNTQALILSPTRELCMQITNDLKSYSKYIGSINVVPVYGGTSIDTQIRELKKGAQIVVGTPGRTNDLIRRKVLKLNNLKSLILDEADEMLSMGFKDEIETILAETPASRQTLLFSATMPKEISSIAKKYMKNADEITVGNKNEAAENVNHIYYMVNAKDKYKALKRIADLNPNIYSIVFCRTRRETQEVAEKLMKDNYNADALHGDLSQAQRDNVMQRFRVKNLQILVATDVAARGLDVNELSHVINYNLPESNDAYIHRSGRTGRAGNKGTSISIIHSREKNKIRDLEKKINKSFTFQNVPGGREICEKQLFNLIDKIEKIEVEEAQIEEFLPIIYEKLSWLSREELIKHFVSAEFNRFLNYYKNAPDLNILTKDEGRGERSKNKRSQSESGTQFSRFFINVGKVDNLNAANIIGLINENSKLRNIEIGKIDILKNFSFFEVDSTYEKNIIDGFSDSNMNGTKLIVELSKEKPKFSETKREKPNNSKRNSKSFEDNSRRGSKSFGDKSKRKPKFSDDKSKTRKRKFSK